MPRKPKSVSDIDRQIEELKEQRTKALEDRAVHIGTIAARADLTTLDISDADLLREFKALATRFQNGRTSTVRSAN